LEYSQNNIESLAKDFENGIGPKYMKTNPQLTDLPLIKALETLHLKAGSWTAMVKSLDEITNLKHAELEIERVESKTQLTDWLRIVNNVLMGGNSVSSQLF
tara:strand:+ start:201 stop:503 length:303 start_codon:yes stop_codon:yes gene_type:complete